MAKFTQKYSEKLVQRVNELFHDFDHDKYHDEHPEIIEQEGKRWKHLGKDLIEEINSPKTITDIGTGTGFVPLTLGSWLTKEDEFVCSDISQGMLDEAQKNVGAKPFSCGFEYKKITPSTPLTLPFKNDSADVVTMNSVLHHIHDTKTILKEMARITKPGGLVFIAHEPNSIFNGNILLQFNYALLSLFFNFKDTIYKIAKFFKIEALVEKMYGSISSSYKKQSQEKREMINDLNKTLIDEDLIKKPLKKSELYSITDIKVGEGFNPQSLLPDFELVQLETYNHMLWVTIKNTNNPLIKAYDKFLHKLFPNSGANFFAVYRKM